MTKAISPASNAAVAAPTASPRQSYGSKLKQIVEVIIQISFRILFIAGSILIASACFPLHWHSFALPVVALGTTLLASFLFPPRNVAQGPYFDALPPLIRPIQGAEPQAQPPVLPPGAPRGLINLSNNCAFNALIHFLEGVPQIAEFFRHPLTPHISLQGFQDFMRQYEPPPQLMADFANYVRSQNVLSPVPALFSTFISTYVPSDRDKVAFKEIQETYQKLNHLHEIYCQFLTAYDQAVQGDQSPVGGTQNLRLALNRIAPFISDQPDHQEDAPELLTQILGVLPHQYQTKIEEQTKYAVGEHPILDNPQGITRKRDFIRYFTLELKDEMNTPRLEELFRNFCDYDVEHQEGIRFQSIDGFSRRYSSHRTIKILEPPPALFFQIKRYYRNEDVPKSWLSRLFPRLAPILGPRLEKRDTPVEAPDQITIPIADGSQKTYRLATFLNQWGQTIESGHYTAACVKNGRKYFINDQTVTLADPQSWEQQRRQAYLLCYVADP